MSQIISEIDEYTILYTSEPQKKTPKFHDGVLKHYKYNSKFQVFSSSNIVVSSEFKRNHVVNEGDEFKVGSVLVNVECLNSHERRDISGIIGKRNPSNKTVTSVITPVKTPNIPSNFLSKTPGSGEKTIGVRKRRIGLSKLSTPSKRVAIATQSPIKETPTSTPSGATSYKSNSIRGYNLLKKDSNSLPSKKLNGRTTGLTTHIDEDSLPSSIPGQGTGKIQLNSLPQHLTPSTKPLREQKERKIISPVSSKVDKPAVSSTKKTEPIEIDYSSEEDEFLERLLQSNKRQVEPQGKHCWPSMMIPSDLSNLMNVVPERRKLKSISLQKSEPQPQTKNNQLPGPTKHPIKLTEIGSDCIGKCNKTATKQTIPLSKIITDINKKMTPVKSVFETFKGAEIPSFEISENEKSNSKDDEYDVHWKEESPKRLRTNPMLKARSQDHVTNTPSKIDFKTLKELREKKEHEEDDEIIATPSLELNEDIVVIKTKTHDFKKGTGNGKVYRISELG